MKMKKGLLILFLGFVAFSASDHSLSMAASDYPTRAIEVILPVAPGGGLDFAMNLFKNRVEKILGQPLVFVYKPGAAGATGTLYATGCKPDGYTLVASTISTLVIPPLTKKGAGYTLDDFVPICNLTSIPQVFCIKDDSPYKTMQDFIQAAKTKKMKYATPGIFTNAHILMEAFSKMAGFQAIHIPYRGSAAGMAAVLGGHIDMLVAASGGFLGPGKLRLLAIADVEQKRLKDHPDIPTLNELGYPLPIGSLDGLWAPKGTPKEKADKIYDAHKKALEENRGEIEKLAKVGEQTVFLTTGEELRKLYQAQHEFYKKMLGEMGALIK
jgi:tripartite-type tricarboxylate transporter receptor subunit TctC